VDGLAEPNNTGDRRRGACAAERHGWRHGCGSPEPHRPRVERATCWRVGAGERRMGRGAAPRWGGRARRTKQSRRSATRSVRGRGAQVGAGGGQLRLRVVGRRVEREATWDVAGRNSRVRAGDFRVRAPIRAQSPFHTRHLHDTATVMLERLPRSTAGGGAEMDRHVQASLSLRAQTGASGGGRVRRSGASEIMGNGRGRVSMRVENKWRNAMEWRCTALVGAQARPRVKFISHG